VWIFDLDDTLHNASTRIFPHISRAMTAYLQTYLGLDELQAGELRIQYWKRYGATLVGLMRHHATDPKHFLLETHQVAELSGMVIRGPGLSAMLRALPGRKLVFSNSPVHYSLAILRTLGIARLFDDVFSIERARFRPKPDCYGFLKLLRCIRVQPSACVMVEDTLENLRTAKKLGMTTVWVANASRRPSYVDFNIRSLLQLPRLAARL
jgi:putative hydrolase of the HAD superfamily